MLQDVTFLLTGYAPSLQLYGVVELSRKLSLSFSPALLANPQNLAGAAGKGRRDYMLGLPVSPVFAILYMDMTRLL